jgi:glyoxylase-like metal-dependent hydrolase (beta-lactamase superfamily II)/8-oxo-dGTP pyrophosphatase MutT (NUDIX family)
MKHVGSNIERKVFDSASVFFYRENSDRLEILLAKRKANLRAFPNLWSGIGGKVSRSDELFIKDSNNPDCTLLKACATREVLEEIGLILLKKELKIITPARDIELQNLEYVLNEYNWQGLLPAGLKETPEFSLVNPIFKAQFFLYKLPDDIDIHLPAEHDEFDLIQWNSPNDWIEGFENQTIMIPPPVLSLLRTFLPNNTPFQAAALSEKRNSLPVGLQTEIEIHPGIYVIPLKSETILPATSTNCFLLGDDDHKYLIDTGSHLDEENERLYQILKGLNPHINIKGILLTHHHKDHWSSINYLQKQMNIPVFAHEKTKMLLSTINAPFVIDKILSDGQIIDLGFDKRNKPWKLEVLITGGHSSDHIVFIDQRFNALLAGDMVAGVGTVLVENMKEYFDSLDKLLSRNIGALLPGHGGIQYEGEKLLRQYKEHRLQRLNLIIEAFQKHSNIATIDQITEIVYSDVAKEYHEFAKIQVKTYLNYLADKNEVFVLDSDKFKYKKS